MVLSFDPRVIIPGHGRPTDQAALEEHLVYLRTVQREVHRCYEAGLSAEKTMDELFQRQDFYPHLGLPERLMIVIELEHSHLSGSSSPSVLELSSKAAAWSYR
ncbi:hypothetical protein CP970_42535 [Streptomyces kanamyceticus]|uniref:MBL fold metallo-hydrolase n=1 Tax=Streptomyces kanamyceticus TaxID=1967 RepID=A0A5J6GUI5_STRKN|nr:hypothetical protein CP970_42535 [Streptomyces kanamyceticus]